MSVEIVTISGLVEEGSPKSAYMAGLNAEDFEIYSDEFKWLEWRFENRKPINKRIFCDKFPNFEYVTSKEDLEKLLVELKDERAFSKVISLIETISDSLEPENAVEKAQMMRDVLNGVVTAHSPHTDISMKTDWKAQYEQVKKIKLLRSQGKALGMPLSIPSLDYHWGGLLNGRMIAVIGRPGSLKSVTTIWMAWQAIKHGYRIGLFSPEMDEFEHTCRMHTIASADRDVQKAIGLKHSFRNKDLMNGEIENMDDYKIFCEYFETLPGDCIIFNKKYRKTPMTIGYLEAKVKDLGLHGIIADPLSKLDLKNRKRENSSVQEDYERVGQFTDLVNSHNIFGVATNWANRGSGKERNPGMDDSFGSDALAKESDHMMSVMYDPEERELALKCSKSRFGVNNFSVELDFHVNTGFVQEKNVPETVKEGMKL